MPFALHRHRLVSCLVAVLLVTAGTPVTAVSTASSTTPSPPVTFTDGIVTEQRGDVVDVGVHFADAEVATVRIGSEENHVATVVVRDDDGDGSAILRLNIYDGTVVASEGDGSSVRERSSAETPLPAGQYDLDLWAGAGTDGERRDVATLAVQERSTDDLRTWVAPASTDLSNLSALGAAKASGNLTRSDTVVKNDTVVFEVRASGLEGALAARNESNVTAQFLSLLESEQTDLDVVQINPGPSIPPKEINLANYSTRVVADAQNDSYHLVTDLSDVNVTGRDGELDEGDEYHANFSLPASSALSTNGAESVRTAFTVVEPTVALSTAGEDREFAVPAPNQTVSGRTMLPPGAELTVELRSVDGERRFSETVRVRNGSDGVGRFAAAFDFSDVPDGTNLTVDVRADAYPDLEFETTRVVVAEPTTRVTTESPIREGTTTDIVTEPASPAEPAVPGIGTPGFGVGSVLVALAIYALFVRSELT